MPPKNNSFKENESEKNEYNQNVLQGILSKTTVNITELYKDIAKGKYSEVFNSKQVIRNFEKYLEKNKNFIKNPYFEKAKKIIPWKSFTENAAKTAKFLDKATGFSETMGDFGKYKAGAIPLHGQEYIADEILGGIKASNAISKIGKTTADVGSVPLNEAYKTQTRKKFDKNAKKYGKGTLLGTDDGWRFTDLFVEKKVDKNGHTTLIQGPDGELRILSPAAFFNYPTPAYGTKVKTPNQPQTPKKSSGDELREKYGLNKHRDLDRYYDPRNRALILNDEDRLKALENELNPYKNTPKTANSVIAGRAYINPTPPPQMFPQQQTQVVTTTQSVPTKKKGFWGWLFDTIVQIVTSIGTSTSVTVTPVTTQPTNTSSSSDSLRREKEVSAQIVPNTSNSGNN